MNLVFSPFMVAFMMALALFAIFLAFRPKKTVTTDLEDRTARLLSAMAVDKGGPAEEMEEPFVQRVLIPLGRSILRAVGRHMPSQMLEAIQNQLVLAGRPGNLTATDFLGLRVLAGSVGLVLGYLYGSRLAADPRLRMLAPLIGTIFFYTLPQSWLTSRIKRRKDVIQRALPDALDMLTVCVEAGLAFEAALQRVSDQWAGPLSDEFARLVSEIRLGVPRPQALRRLAQRCDVPDVTSFVAVLVQAHSMGTSIALVLRSQADQIRTLRRQRAEEKANKAPIKVLVVMLLFIFPALFVVILGPAVPKVIDAFSAMGGR